ncbi:hypothetical protein CONPUDRAFT_148163 [Coniophora puteana RWD-64-598 SS2]|uniref:Uncharacterized protein n=1 Tax=Coniophora puteana (strain RWD-64-598) TaxID=741705 RepID=A0A5M3N3Q8_CONPW|nr:uncharacterized protein CONPUDRAFT_148163 [Coniophora puteana RWD-64-598 SS2]EIW86042.1 hypothetical protein CONPUDRAFT_148163 [Coniophora puteana RWD-64-598 SS2]
MLSWMHCVDHPVQEDKEKEVEAIESDPIVLIASGGTLLFYDRPLQLVYVNAPALSQLTPLTFYYSPVVYHTYLQNLPQYIGRTKSADSAESYAIPLAVVVNRIGVLSMGPEQGNFKDGMGSSVLQSGAAKNRGREAVVIGADKISADISQDIVSKGAAPTLVQRNVMQRASYHSSGAGPWAWSTR